MRGLALAAALLSAAVLSGCGAHDEGESSPAAYRFELSMAYEGLAPGSPATGIGAFDPVAEAYLLRYEFDGLTTEVRRIAGDVYAGEGNAENPIRWRHGQPDVFFGPVGALAEPHRVADALARRGGDVQSKPGEAIDGLATTHRRGTLPTAELVADYVAGEDRAELEADNRESESETAVVETWTDADGLLRRLEVAIPVSEDGRRGRFVAAARLLDFGEPVTIEVPPLSDDEELPESMARPCPGATPHAAVEVANRHRAAGFGVRPTCFGGETAIDAVAADGSHADEIFGCMVFPAPVPPEELEGRLVAANVACDPQTPELRERVQAVLDGL